LAVSSARNLPKAPPETAPGSAPSSVSRAFLSEVARIAATSVCSFSSTAGGVLAAADIIASPPAIRTAWREIGCIWRFLFLLRRIPAFAVTKERARAERKIFCHAWR
jgi:hypothetical protein